MRCDLTRVCFCSLISNQKLTFHHRSIKWQINKMATLQTHHVDSTLKRCGNGRFHVVSTWNPRGVFVGKYHRVVVWYSQAMRLKIRSSHFTCKTVNKYLNDRQWAEVAGTEKNCLLPFLAIL